MKRVFALSFLFWTIGAAAFASQAWVLLSRTSPWITIFTWTLAHAWSWALFTPIVFIAAATRSPALTTIAVVMATFGQPLVQFVAMRLLLILEAPLVFQEPQLGGMMLGKLHVNAAISAAIAGLAIGLDVWRKSRDRELRNARLESLLARAELEAVRARFQPHFLFNALNSAASLVDSDPSAAKRMIIRFANLLRASLRLSAAEWITLAEELRQIEGYLDIERIRFDERLVIRVEVDPIVSDALLPPLLLQPIVENAVKHGAGRRVGRTTVTLAAARKNDMLAIEISDRGDAPSSKPVSGLGEGLRYIESRLRLVYGSAYEFQLLHDRGETTVRLGLPLRYRQKEAAG